MSEKDWLKGFLSINVGFSINKQVSQERSMICDSVLNEILSVELIIPIQYIV